MESNIEYKYCRGWFIGDKKEKKALEKDLRERHPDVVWEGSDLRELNESKLPSEMPSLPNLSGRDVVKPLAAMDGKRPVSAEVMWLWSRRAAWQRSPFPITRKSPRGPCAV